MTALSKPVEVAGAVAAVGFVGAYVGSYAWEKLSRPEGKNAQNEVSELKKAIKLAEHDEKDLLQSLERLRSSNFREEDKLELQRNVHLFVKLCAKKPNTEAEFAYSFDVVSTALDVIRSLVRMRSEDAANVKALCAVGGMKVLFVALTCAFRRGMQNGDDSQKATSLVEKLLGVIDEAVSFDMSEIVLPFDAPAAACAALQLSEVKGLASLSNLLRDDYGFAHKRTKVLGILAHVSALRQGAQRIFSADVSCIDQLLFLAANNDAKPTDYKAATHCVRNLCRHLPAARERVLSAADGKQGLVGLQSLREQFVELLDGGHVGIPPRTQSSGRQRDPSATAAALDCLREMLEASDSRKAANEALLANNQRGVLALMGVTARMENKQVRQRAAVLFSLVNDEVRNYAETLSTYNGSGEMAATWGTGFKVVQELHMREQMDREIEMAQKRRMQQQYQQLMQRTGASPEALEAMLGGGGGAGLEEMMMMMGGGQ